MSKVAILLATYNGANYLSELLDSLIKQTYSNWICYIHDDGSTDRTPIILQKYRQKYPQKFKLLAYPATGGPKENFISLLKYPKADYIMFCDQDDVWLPKKISLTLQKMKASESSVPIVIFTDLKVVDQNLAPIADSYLAYTGRNPRKLNLVQLLHQNVASGCTMMINRSLLELAQAHPTLLRLAMHDWGLMLLASVYGRIGYLEQATILYRQHQSNQVGAARHNINERVHQVLKGEKLEAVRENISLQRAFAKELNQQIAPDNRYASFLQQFSQIEQQSKLVRVKFYLAHHLIDFNLFRFWRLLFV